MNLVKKQDFENAILTRLKRLLVLDRDMYLLNTTQDFIKVSDAIEEFEDWQGCVTKNSEVTHTISNANATQQY